MAEIRSTPAIGVVFHPSFPPETLADFARKAEAGGFDELWLWDDSFMPGALTAAAIALSATQRLKVGIGLIPATAYNPLFAAMEITTLARAFPKRFMPGFGYGVGSWMAQIGAAQKPTMKTLGDTVTSIRRLLCGEMVTVHGVDVNLEQVQMQVTPAEVPPLFVGAMREKSLQLAGRVGDGTILTAMSSPEYVRWALGNIRAGNAEAGRTDHRVVVYLDVKVSRDPDAARAAMRQALAERLPWVDSHMNAVGIAQEVEAFIQAHGAGAVAQRMPDEWLDAFSAAGTPDQVAVAIQRWAATGVDSIILQPLNGDPDCLDEYIRDVLPRLKPGK